MIKRLLFWISGSLRCRLINRGAPYMERYALIDSRWATVYLHRFVSGDGDLELHDHPWSWAASFVLTGHYLEERLAWFDADGPVTKLCERRWVNFIGPNTFHRIICTRRDTWTLFIHGPKVKAWGWLNRVGEMQLWLPALEPQGQTEWKQTAPVGRDAGREPLR